MREKRVCGLRVWLTLGDKGKGVWNGDVLGR